MKKAIIKSIYLIALGSLFNACDQVQTIQPKKTDIVDAVFASGYIISEQEYQVTANTEGYLIQSLVDEGTKVEAGMPLFQLSNGVQSENLSNAEANYQEALRKLSPSSPQRVQQDLLIDQARSQLMIDKKNYDRYQKLKITNAVSEMEFEKVKLQYENSVRTLDIQEKTKVDLVKSLELNLKNANTQLAIQQENNSDYFLSSMIEGQVLKVLKQTGELVRRGEPVALIGGGKKRVKLFISEEDILLINEGQRVVVNLNTEKDQIRNAVITKVYPSFDEVEQSFIAEATFKSQPTALYHNTQLQANIIIAERDDVLVIPSDFLVNKDSVRLKNGDIRFVRTGLQTDEWVEIVEGLNQSDVLQKPSSS